MFQQTYGAKYGKGSQLCGTYMYNEIVAAGKLLMVNIAGYVQCVYCSTLLLWL